MYFYFINLNITRVQVERFSIPFNGCGARQQMLTGGQVLGGCLGQGQDSKSKGSSMIKGAKQTIK